MAVVVPSCVEPTREATREAMDPRRATLECNINGSAGLICQLSLPARATLQQLRETIQEERGIPWQGQHLFSGVEELTCDLDLARCVEQARRFVVGAQVRAKAGVKTPRYGWGCVAPQQVGVLSAIWVDEGLCTVDFPEQPGWFFAVAELEVVADAFDLLLVRREVDFEGLARLDQLDARVAAMKRAGAGRSRIRGRPKQAWVRVRGERLCNQVAMDAQTYERLLKEVPQAELITPAVVSECLRVNGSVARQAILHLEERGLVKRVGETSVKQMIFTHV